MTKFNHIPAHQICAKYINALLTYYYFRFLKSNIRYVGILLPVSIFTFALRSACNFASVYQVSSKTDHPRQIYDVISSFQYGGHDISILLPVSVFGVSAHLERSKSVYTPNFGEIYQFAAEIWKQTSAMLDCYFWFKHSRLRHHRHVILHLPAKLRLNRKIHDRVMTSYPFSKMADNDTHDKLKYGTESV